MNFWETSEGEKLTGDERSSFTESFEIIPDRTTAIADIVFIERAKPTEHYLHDKYSIVWKITSNDFIRREVTQNLKCFDDNSRIANRSKNMLVRLYKLFGLKAASGNAPETEDLQLFVGKKAGIKINEYSMIKNDGETACGNYVSEVHDIKGFICAKGVKKEEGLVKSTSNNTLAANCGLDDALGRNKPNVDLEDIPF
jgi:hypothetical protein